MPIGLWKTYTFLLEFCPLAVPAGEQRIAVLPECVLAFLGFLEVIGRLKGPDSPDELERAVTGARGRFEAEMRDIGAWGYAKSVAMQQFPEGIDPDERRLIDAWLTDSIRPPSRERDATLGSVERLTRSPAASASTPNASKRAKRRSARHARKRNRR